MTNVTFYHGYTRNDFNANINFDLDDFLEFRSLILYTKKMLEKDDLDFGYRETVETILRAIENKRDEFIK